MIDRRDFLKYIGVAGAGAALFNINNLASAARPKPRLPAQSSSNQINILFDSWSTQVMVQQLPSNVYFPPSFTPGPDYNTGLRLNTLLGAMQSFGFGTTTPTPSNRAFNISYTYTNPPISPDQLAGKDVYVSLTRMQGDEFAYTADELNLLSNFVSNGKGILLMTNHGPLPNAPNDNYTKNDAALAQKFFNILLQPYYVTLNNYMVMDVNNQDSALQYIANQVTAIVAHDSCVIVPPNAPFYSIAKFPIGAQAYDSVTGKWTTPVSPYFSIMVPYGAGKVIIVGNSGMMGDYGSPYPAPGIIPLENNLMFFLNCIGFLAGFNCIPQPGQGPCANSSALNIGAIDSLLLQN
jgi:TAT (twin-arginine translocation) pathway signal sequence